MTVWSQMPSLVTHRSSHFGANMSQIIPVFVIVFGEEVQMKGVHHLTLELSVSQGLDWSHSNL